MIKQLSIILFIFNVLDAAFTSIAVREFGWGIETNPIMRWTMITGGIPLFVGSKVGISGLSTAIFYRFASRNLYTRIVLWMVTTGYAVIVANSLYQFYWPW